MSRLVAVMGAVALLGASCREPGKPRRQQQPAAARQQPATKPRPAPPGPGPAEMARLSAPRGLEQACRTLYGVLQRRMALIKKHRGARPHDRQFPAVEPFVAGCKNLPPAAVRCMVPALLKQHRAACVHYLEHISQRDRARVDAFRATLL